MTSRDPAFIKWCGGVRAAEWNADPDATAVAHESDIGSSPGDRDVMTVAASDLESVARRWAPSDVQGVRSTGSLRLGTRSAFVMIAGDASVLERPALAIVGTRRVPAAQAGNLRRLIDELVRSTDRVVVSGGAFGVDTMVHEAALAAGRPAVVVLAGGLLHPGPRGNVAAFHRLAASGGVVMSDRPPAYRPFPADFQRRNRMIAALGEATIVVRAGVRSGALGTAARARALGRPVLAVPGEPWDETAAGCIDLLRQGASVYAGPSDAERAVGGVVAIGFEPMVPRPFPPVLRPLDEALRAGATTVDRVVRLTGTDVATVQAWLLEAELLGLVGRDAVGRLVRLGGVSKSGRERR